DGKQHFAHRTRMGFRPVCERRPQDLCGGRTVGEHYAVEYRAEPPRVPDRVRGQLYAGRWPGAQFNGPPDPPGAPSAHHDPYHERPCRDERGEEEDGEEEPSQVEPSFEVGKGNPAEDLEGSDDFEEDGGRHISEVLVQREQMESPVCDQQESNQVSFPERRVDRELPVVRPAHTDLGKSKAMT